MLIIPDNLNRSDSVLPIEDWGFKDVRYNELVHSRGQFAYQLAAYVVVDCKNSAKTATLSISAFARPEAASEDPMPVPREFDESSVLKFFRRLRLILSGHTDGHHGERYKDA